MTLTDHSRGAQFPIASTSKTLPFRLLEPLRTCNPVMGRMGQLLRHRPFAAVQVAHREPTLKPELAGKVRVFRESEAESARARKRERKTS